MKLLFVFAGFVFLATNTACEEESEAAQLSDEIWLTSTSAVFDKNGDGLISSEELKSFLEEVARKPVSDEDVQEVMRKIYKNGHGITDFAGLLNWFTEDKNKDLREEVVRKIFKILDKDKNELIDENELKEYIDSVGEPLSDDELKDIMKVGDTDRDGKLNFEEFKQVINTTLEEIKKGIIDKKENKVKGNRRRYRKRIGNKRRSGGGRHSKRRGNRG